MGQVAELTEPQLVEMVGRAAGRKLHALAHNRDPRPVKRAPRRRSFGSQCALGRGPTSPEALDATVLALVDRVTRRMRAKGRAGRTVMLRLRFGDFTRATRSHTLPEPTSATSAVLAEMRDLLAAEQELIARRGITLVGVSVGNLEAGSRQLQLPLDRRARRRARPRARRGPRPLRRHLGDPRLAAAPGAAAGHLAVPGRGRLMT